MTTSLEDGTMVDKMAQFDLPKEIADAEKKKPWPSGINAKTLFKKHDFRVVLVSMENAAHMKEHHADGTLSIQVLKGRLHVYVNGKYHELGIGSLFTLGHSIRHDVAAKRLGFPAHHLLAQRGRTCGHEAPRLRLLVESQFAGITFSAATGSPARNFAIFSFRNFASADQPPPPRDAPTAKESAAATPYA